MQFCHHRHNFTVYFISIIIIQMVVFLFNIFINILIITWKARDQCCHSVLVPYSLSGLLYLFFYEIISSDEWLAEHMVKLVGKTAFFEQCLLPEFLWYHVLIDQVQIRVRQFNKFKADNTSPLAKTELMTLNLKNRQ